MPGRFLNRELDIRKRLTKILTRSSIAAICSSLFLPLCRTYRLITLCWSMQRSPEARRTPTSTLLTTQTILMDRGRLPGRDASVHLLTKKTGISSAETCAFIRFTACRCSEGLRVAIASHSWMRRIKRHPLILNDQWPASVPAADKGSATSDRPARPRTLHCDPPPRFRDIQDRRASSNRARPGQRIDCVLAPSPVRPCRYRARS